MVIMIQKLVNFLVHSPIYPHWLEHHKMRLGDEAILKGTKGKILEVGAGDGSKKSNLIVKYPKITSYTATDYSSWDDEFESFDSISKKYGLIGRLFMGRGTRAKLDGVCSATELPFKKNSFDVHLSFEVLEHINDPAAYFKEAARVTKPKGKIIFSVPFMYREHKMDFLRYTPDYLEYIAKENGLKVKSIYNNTGYGTTKAVFANQWLVRRIVESNLLIKVPLFIISPVYFCLNNLWGLFLDIRPDRRFATRFHVILQKP